MTTEMETEQPAAEVENPADTSADAPRAERVKRLPKPDDTELSAQVKALQEEITTHQDRIKYLRDLVGKKQSSRSSVSGEQQSVKKKLADLRNKFQNELAKKQRIRDELEAVSKVRIALREAMRSSKTRVEYTSVEKIDEEIKRLENKQQHTSLNPQEEKQVVQAIEKLKAARTTVAQHSERLEKMDADGQLHNQITERLKACDVVLDGIKVEEEVLREELANVKAREELATADVPSLIEERDECKQVVDLLYEHIRKLRAEFKHKADEYYERERQYREQMRVEKKKAYDQRQAERALKDAEWQARKAEQAGEPYDKEVTSCDQLVAYLSKYVAAADTAAEAKAEIVHLTGPGVGGVVKSKKDENELDGWFAGLGAGKNKGKGKKKGAKGGADDKPAEQKLTHSLDIITAFADLKVEVPLTSGRAGDAIEQLKERKEYYLERRQKVKENGGPLAEPVAEAADTNGAVDGEDEDTEAAEANGGNPVTSVLTVGDDDTVSVSLSVNEAAVEGDNEEAES